MKQVADALRGAIEAAHDADAEDAEASYSESRTEFVRFASSRFTQVGVTCDTTVRIRAIADGRMGSQMTASLDPSVLAQTARTAVEAARLSPVMDVEVGFTKEGTTEADAEPKIHRASTATSAPAQLATAFEPYRTDGVLFAGALKSRLERRAVRTAGGCARDSVTGLCDVQVIGLKNDSSGYAGYLVASDREVDFAAVVAKAADTALRGVDPIALKPGTYDVVLAPAALAALLEWMSKVSFGGRAMLDCTSALAGREGEMLCDPRITIADRTRESDCGFDPEGTLRSEVVFIDHGKGGKVVTDRVTAARLGDPRGSTGHAPPIDDEFVTGPCSQHLVMEPGNATELELIRRVDRGLYVTRLHYVDGMLNPHKATMTGMTRAGTFLIEKGEIGPCVVNLRFTEHMLDAFGRIGGVGRQLIDIPTWWSKGGTVSCPALLIRDFSFTGSSR